LLSFNSLKIPWIAFIVKREKIYLLILTVIISGLLIVNLVIGTESQLHSSLITSLTPMMSKFSQITLMYGAVYFSILFFTILFHIPTAEAFDRKAQEVSSLQYFSKLITRVLDFNELSETVTDITLKVGSADASWIIWKNMNEFESIAPKGAGYIDTEAINNFLLEKNKWESFNSPKFFSLDKIPELVKLSNQFKVIATTPLKTHGELKGVLVSARKSSANFNEEEKSAITTFSDYASVALENSRLLEESIEKERLEKELDVAREIQRKILPSKNPDIDNLEIVSVFIPAFEVGGDYYDFFPVSETQLGFIIADVSGKGISAAFIMAEVKGIFESLSKTIVNPKNILIKANEILRNTLDSKTFVSAAYGLLDIDKKVMYLSRAGHCPILHIRGDSAEKIKPTGLGLGMSDSKYFEATLEEIVIHLQENDTIVLYTDGITEAKDHNLNDFGEKYFTEILLENRQKSAQEISNNVIREVSLFSKDHSQYDDITLMILKWKTRTSNNGGRDRQKIIINGETEWQSSKPRL
jgi:serine phosphatase RsbU (regulator of sigma subunit)